MKQSSAPFGCDGLQVHKARSAREDLFLHVFFQAFLRQTVPECNAFDKTLDVIQCCAVLHTIRVSTN